MPYTLNDAKTECEAAAERWFTTAITLNSTQNMNYAWGVGQGYESAARLIEGMIQTNSEDEAEANDS